MKVYHGKIISCNEEMQVFEYLVEHRGKIVYVGDNLPETYETCEQVELGDKVMMPSFVDSHIHFASFALFNATLDIRNVVNFDDLETKLVDFYRRVKPKMILAFGISPHSVEEKTMVTRERLDEMPIDCPIMLIKYDGHASVVNSQMLNKLPTKIQTLRGYDAAQGHMLQEAYFKATDYVTGKVSLIDLVKNMVIGVDQLAEYGIGMIHTVEGVGFALDLDVKIAKLFAKGLRNSFNFRIFFQTMQVKKVLKMKFRRIGGCFETALDGCFGSVDAALTKPYKGTTNNGILFNDDEEVLKFVRHAHGEGLQISMHAIGDQGFEQALSAYETVLMESPRNNHRHTIIHGCLASKDQLQRAGKIGLHLSVQPGFIHWDLEPYDYMETLLGERVNELNALKSMIDSGITVSGGSDGPCTVPNPIEGIYCACNHYNKEQSVSVHEALRMYTYYGAYGTFDETSRGTLEEGKVADMIVLNKNPLEMEPAMLRELKVINTYLAGRLYRKNQGLGSLLRKGFFGKGKLHTGEMFEC